MKHRFRLAYYFLVLFLFLSTSYSLADPQSDLAQLRSQIDVLDKQILELINKRAQVVFDIGELKRKNDLEVYDPNREKVIEQNLIKMNTGPMPNASIIKIFKTIIEASRGLQ